MLLVMHQKFSGPQFIFFARNFIQFHDIFASFLQLKCFASLADYNHNIPEITYHFPLGYVSTLPQFCIGIGHGMLVCKVAFSSFSIVNQSACSTLD